AQFFQRHETGGQVAAGDAKRSARLRAVLVGEIEELLGLLRHAHDPHRPCERTRGERGVNLEIHLALPAWDRIAVRIGGVVAEPGTTARAAASAPIETSSSPPADRIRMRLR